MCPIIGQHLSSIKERREANVGSLWIQIFYTARYFQHHSQTKGFMSQACWVRAEDYLTVGQYFARKNLTYNPSRNLQLESNQQAESSLAKDYMKDFLQQ